ATPAAPAPRISVTRSAVTPPIASTGTRAAAVASRSAATPCGGPNTAFDGVAYTGPKTAKSAAVAASSAGACLETPITARGASMRRTTSTGIEPPPRWTPSAPTATATSTRSFTRRRAPVRAVSARRRSARSSSARPDRSLSRRCTAGKPASSARATTSTRSRPPVAWRSVTRTSAGASADTPIHGARGRRVQLPRDATGEDRLAARFAGETHRLGHEDRIARAGDGRVHEDGVAAQLERLAGVRRGADAGVDDHRDAALLDDDPEVARGAGAEPRADGRGQRHDRDAAELLQPLAGDGVVGDVGHHLEAVRDQQPRRLDRGGHVGEQRLLVAQHLELQQRGDNRL